MSNNAPVTDNRPLVPAVVAGTSIGAYNAALLLTALHELGGDPYAAVDYLEEIWTELIPNDDRGPNNHVYRYRADPLDLFDPTTARSPVAAFERFADDLGFLGSEA